MLLLLCLGGILVVFDSFSATEPPPPEPEDPVVVRAAQLDDPVGFKSHWLQQQGYKADRSIEAVARQQHSSAESLRAAQLKQPGVICTNTCFKVCVGCLACSCALLSSSVCTLGSGPAAAVSVWGVRGWWSMSNKSPQPTNDKRAQWQQQGNAHFAMKWKRRAVCPPSPPQANDGVCDEGRRGNLTLGTSPNWVYCDLGTDCAVRVFVL